MCHLLRLCSVYVRWMKHRTGELVEYCWKFKLKCRWKACPIGSLSITNSTRTLLGYNLVLGGEKPVHNSLSNGTDRQNIDIFHKCKKYLVIILYYTILYYTILYYTILYYTYRQLQRKVLMTTALQNFHIQCFRKLCIHWWMLVEIEVQEAMDNKTGLWHIFMTPISEISLSSLLWNNLVSNFAGKR